MVRIQRPRRHGKCPALPLAPQFSVRGVIFGPRGNGHATVKSETSAAHLALAHASCFLGSPCACPGAPGASLWHFGVEILCRPGASWSQFRGSNRVWRLVVWRYDIPCCPGASWSSLRGSNRSRFASSFGAAGTLRPSARCRVVLGPRLQLLVAPCDLSIVCWIRCQPFAQDLHKQCARFCRPHVRLHGLSVGLPRLDRYKQDIIRESFSPLPRMVLSCILM